MVRHALLRWGGLRADNITAIAVIFDPPGCQYAPVHPGTPRLLKPSESLTTRLDTTAVNCLLRIGSTETHLIETSPVELVYYGQVDPKLPEVEDSSIRLVESMPADTNDVAPDSPNVVITTEFIQATSAVSVHMRDESGSDSPVLANDNSDQVVPPGPHPCTVVQQSIFHLVSQSTAVEGNNTHLERQELTTTTVTTSNVEGNPLKKRKYYCKKHGHNCIKAKQMNSDWLAQCSKTSNHLNSAADQSQDNSEEEVSHSEETVEKSPKEAEIPTSMISAVEPELSPNGIIESSPSVGSKRESPANERQQRRSILKGISVMGTRLGRTRSTGPNVTRSGKVYHKSIPNFTSSLTSERRSLRNRSLR